MQINKWFSVLLLSFTFALNANAESDNSFNMTTTAFLDTGALPVLYTCDGKDISPQLNWTNPPAKTQSFVVVVSDEDAPGGVFYHWVVYNIPASTTELAEGVQNYPTKTLVGENSWSKKQYNGPCPPRGTAHTYYFTVYALDNTVKLPAGTDGKTVLASIKNHIVGKTKISAVYSRWLK